MSTMPMPYDTGGEDDWGEDGYAVAPDPVSRVVSPGVAWADAPPVSPVVALVVSPAEDGDGDQGNDGPPIGVGHWETAGDGQPAGPAAKGRRLSRLRAAVDGSELLGGGPGGLLAELADPHPETMRQHWEHVTRHPRRPQDPWAGPAFTAGHLAVTGPTKATGKSLIAVGNALVFAGTRADWAGDRFIRNAVPVAVIAALIAIILIFT